MTDEVLSAEALAFVDRLHRQLNPERDRLLARREGRRGERPRFVRAPADFTVASAPTDLRDRRVEITGPVDRKMMINALNSGARVFMADFEDANSPSWENVVEGQRNVRDAVRGTISLDSGREALPAERRSSDARDSPARLASRRAASRGGRRAGVGVAL